MIQHQSYGLVGGFLRSADLFPDRIALVVNGEGYTYHALQAEASRIARAIAALEPEPYPLAAVFAHRSVTAYASILGILASGKGYVPLNPKFPVERTRRMLSLSGCKMLIVGKEAIPQLAELIAASDRSLTLLLPDVAESGGLPALYPKHRFVTSGEFSASTTLTPPIVDVRSPAYLLFTSGSTGHPKGVPISHVNVGSYIRYTCDRYEVGENDRFSQEFDYTFDLSVHDMFVCWERGACLFCVPEKSVMAPAKFIRDNALTMWFSVPSVVNALTRLGLLQPGVFPSLRFSLFCGEPLAACHAQQWQKAAPNSILENLYGPTEATIAISNYRWNRTQSPEQCLNGIVPLGNIFDGQEYRIVDPDRKPVGDREVGELCLTGSQVSTGYWNDLTKTAEQFVHLDGGDKSLWYRTGDIVKQADNGCIFYLGRTDHQVKIRGHRVELQEIDGVIQKVCGSAQVVSLPWPIRNGSGDGIATFVSSTQSFDQTRILSHCSEVLPDYMVPKRICFLDELPLSVNGKVDRNKLLELLEADT